MRNIPRCRRQLAGFYPLIFFAHPWDALGVAFQPERDWRAQAFLVQLGEFDHHVFSRVRRKVMQLAHVDAVGWAWLGAQRTEKALAVVDGVADQLAAFGVDLAGFLVDLSGPGFVDVDAIDRAGLSAHVAGDAFVLLELMNATISRRESQPLLGILNRDRFLKTILQGDLHADRDRGNVVVNIAKVGFGVHCRNYGQGREVCHSRAW